MPQLERNSKISLNLGNPDEIIILLKNHYIYRKSKENTFSKPG